MNDEIEGANELITAINNSSKKAKSMAEKMLNSAYAVCDKEGNYFLNDMLVKLDLYNFKLEKVIYNDGIALRKRNTMQTGNMTTELEYERLNETMNKAGKKNYHLKMLSLDIRNYYKIWLLLQKQTK